MLVSVFLSPEQRRVEDEEEFEAISDQSPEIDGLITSSPG